MTVPLALHTVSTLMMTGLIWFVQLVHYPLFRYASAGDFPAFAAAHQRRTTWLVLPLMSIELATALWLWVAPDPTSGALTTAGLVLLATIWLSTGLMQVPLHRRLAHGFERHAARLLVSTNWLRTVAWSARSAIALGLLAR